MKTKNEVGIVDNKRTILKKAFKRDYFLYMLLILPAIYFLVFKYIPMYGIILAFRKFVQGQSAFGVEWVGFRYFKLFLTDKTFWNIFKNTVLLSLMNLVIGFPLPIIFALLLNEIHNNAFKKVVQTVSYLPKFLSTVIVVAMINILLSPSTGIINDIIAKFGNKPIFFLNEIEWFRTIYISSDIWQFMGWNAILYIASLASVDTQLYEAAVVDGANKWKQMIHVTIPGIMPTIVITFILAVGYMLSAGFEKILLLYTPSTYQVADVIQTFVYRVGLVGNNFSYATAIGLFQALISLTLLWTTNHFASKYTDYSLW
ncbi:ABC transporter permease [Clostridium grantii]|uniref:Carbohydrate ABC transporter membrane protein 1, CUT1 family (TC 3.A.1.1.-) n=1 Tax=Clostridium grantii DSM 8605 TaxID=1121316 RepID=A0A1M5WAX1_9CLOT|nr:carbohydrate ABC transporter membrane protein 1, CUT1 family (TC 3.A.1.1.-) [Clostridium grantii DSM 8605]